MFFLSIPLSAFSLTLLIDTRVEVPREDMEIREKTRVVSLESGIMDVLFEEGHIFFNMYSLQAENNEVQSDAEILKYAKDLGAGFFLILKPDDHGSFWRLSRVDGSGSGVEGFADIDDIDQDGSVRERWIKLGTALAKDVIALMN